MFFFLASSAFPEDQVAYYTPEAYVAGASSPAYTPVEPHLDPPEQPKAKTIYEMIIEAEQQAEDHFNLPVQVRAIMKAIKKVESKGYPWALCVNLGNGKSYSIYPKNYWEAVYYLEHLRSDNIDIGPWQVNYLSWGKPYRLKKADLLNPYTSAMIAAYILYSEVAIHGQTWDAIGNYHSHTLSRKVPYVKDVKKALRKEGYFVD